MAIRYYRLEGHEVVPTSLETWDEAMAGHMAVVYQLTQDAKETP